MPLVLLTLLALQIHTPPAEDRPANRLDFTEVQVRGAVVAPAGSVIWGKPKAHKRNLVELRRNFRPELVHGADTL